MLNEMTTMENIELSKLLRLSFQEDVNFLSWKTLSTLMSIAAAINSYDASKRNYSYADE